MQLIDKYRDLVQIGALALIVAVSATLAQNTTTDSPATTESAGSPNGTNITSEAPVTTTEMPAESPTTGTSSTTNSTTNMPDNSGGSTTSHVTEDSSTAQPTEPPATTENMLSDGMTSTSGPTVVNQTPVRCFTCFANLTTDECYMQPNGSQHCASGEHCWTHAYYEAEKFVNLTRSCRKPICSDTTRENQCEEAKGIKLCSQCCSDDLCNQKDAGTAALGQSGILLSALVVLSIISW